MKKQLRGIALILFGILLAIVSVAIEPFSAGETYMIWCLAGGVCGIAGLVMAFAKDATEADINFVDVQKDSWYYSYVAK